MCFSSSLCVSTCCLSNIGGPVWKDLLHKYTTGCFSSGRVSLYFRAILPTLFLICCFCQGSTLWGWSNVESTLAETQTLLSMMKVASNGTRSIAFDLSMAMSHPKTTSCPKTMSRPKIVWRIVVWSDYSTPSCISCILCRELSPNLHRLVKSQLLSRWLW